MKQDYLEPQLQEGSTVPLDNYTIESYGGYREEGVWFPEHHEVVHYVGGEDHVFTHSYWSTAEDAQRTADSLNNTLPPEGYTHLYYVE